MDTTDVPMWAWVTVFLCLAYIVAVWVFIVVVGIVIPLYRHFTRTRTGTMVPPDERHR